MTSELVPKRIDRAMRSAADHPIFRIGAPPDLDPRLSLQALRGEANNPREELFGRVRVNPSTGEQTTAQSKGKPETEQNICCIPVEGFEAGDARWGPRRCATAPCAPPAVCVLRALM